MVTVPQFRGQFLAGAFDDAFLSGNLIAASSGRIILVAGQSNAAGRKFIEEVSQPQHDLLQPAFPGVTLREWEATNASPPVLLYDTATQTGTQTPVRSDGPLAPRPYALPTPNMGCELSLGRYLGGYAPGFSLVKFSVGGTDLATHWNPDGTYPTAQNNLFTQLVAYGRTAETALGGKIVAIVWIQGESDADDPTQAANYGANLSAFITRLRLTWPGLPFVYNRLSSSEKGTYKNDVRAGQTTVANTVTRTWMIDVDDLVLDSGLHFVPDSYVTMGYRFGPSVINAIGNSLGITADFSFKALTRAVTFTDRSVDPNVSGVPNAQSSITTWAWDFGDGATASTATPSHTYAADGAYTVRLTVGDAAGNSATTYRQVTVATPTWSTDATSGIGVPAGTTEWSALRAKHSLLVGNPTNLHLLQEASGSILDKVGTKDLVFGASLPTYQRTKSGWSRYFIGASGAATTQHAQNTTLTDISSSSWMTLVYLTFNTTATNRKMVSAGNGAVNELQVAGGTNLARKRSGAVGVNSTLNHAGVVRPYVLRYANAPQLDEMFSDIEKISIAYAAQTGTILDLNFSLSLDAAFSADMAYVATWRGTDAEISQSEIRHLLQALGWETTGYA